MFTFLKDRYSKIKQSKFSYFGGKCILNIMTLQNRSRGKENEDQLDKMLISKKRMTHITLRMVGVRKSCHGVKARMVVCVKCGAEG